ncbi:hypothetical protein GGR50DRAFT_668288 [Xylaria sp. CBS 124048]|nr:hypothetical protein GGR50DRAFT_668288 [Xylaria sp. CBS 124048]
MAYDNSLNPSTTANHRPQMPSLSASAARGMNRAPLTPKIASASRSSRPQSPGLATVTGTTTTTTTAAFATPLAKRTQPRPISTSSTVSSSNRVLYDDDHSVVSTATFSPHLSSNITPRSASRQSRVDSASNTPTGTPNPDRSDNWDSKSSFALSGSISHPDFTRRPIVTFTGVSPEHRAPSRQDVANPRDSKFFHASDIKAKPSSKNSSRNSNFFYANGDDIAPVSAHGPAAPSLSSLAVAPGPSPSPSQENVSSKFMYANGTPELPPTSHTTLSRRSSSAVATSSRGQAASSIGTGASQRPTMSSKQSSSHRNSTGAQSTSTNSTTTAASTSSHVRPTSTPQLGPSPPGLRRPGMATSRSGGHSRASSLAKEESSSEASRPVAPPINTLFPPANLASNQPPPLTLASIVQAAEEFELTEPENDDVPAVDDQATLQSPTKSNVSSADPVTDLITSARRERRVQDLQIRNASLEAINRTLERQLRKNSAELRSYKRLSRSGQLSVASTAASSRVPSGTLLEGELEALGLSDLDEEESQLTTGVEVELEEADFSDTGSASSDLSPGAQAVRDAKHRQLDEQRLTIDLSKHQQILVDSQKINKSIKRCLDWTEELIKSGRKALEYKIQLSDVQIGGRVLDPLDEDEHTGALLANENNITSNTLDMEPTEEERLSRVSTTWSAEPQDRDSGIEMLKDGG